MGISERRIGCWKTLLSCGILCLLGCEVSRRANVDEPPPPLVVDDPDSLPIANWQGLKVVPPIIKIDEEPKETTISWKEKGDAVARIYDFRGVLVRELQGQHSVTWNGTWPNHAKYPAPVESGPYAIEIRRGSKTLHRGTVYVDRAGPRPRYLYMKAHRRFPRSREENSPESSGQSMSLVRYPSDVSFSWWWGVEKQKDGKLFVWDKGQKKILPKGDYGAGIYFLNGRFILQVSTDPEFKNIVHQSRHRTKPWGHNVSLKKGRYFWRLIGMDARGNPVLKHKDPATGETVPYTSQVVEFEVEPNQPPSRKLSPSPLKNMSRARFESLAFSTEETAKWGKPKAVVTSKFTAGQKAYWHGSKIERSWLSKRLSARRRIGSFEMALSEEACYPEEKLVAIFKLNTNAVIDENLKKYRPPRESYNTRFDNGNFYEHVKVRWKQGHDNPDRLLRLGLLAAEASKLRIEFKILSRRDGKILFESSLPVVARPEVKLPKGVSHAEPKDGLELSAFDGPIGYEIDLSQLPLARAGTQQFLAEARLLRGGKLVHLLSQPFGRTRRPTLYRMNWGKIEINDDRAIYINGRPVFPHSMHRGGPVTTRLHGFNANFANSVPAETAKKIHSIQVEIANRGSTARNFGKWMLHEPSFEKSVDYWDAVKKMKPDENILLISTTTGGWTGECKVFDFYAADGTEYRKPVLVLPYQHVGGPELTGFFIDTGVARAEALEEMGVRTTIYTECGIYRIGRQLTPHGPNETIANAYAAIIHGCRGIDWFGEYSHENGGALSYLQPDTYSRFYRVLGAQINWLQPILCAARVKQDASIWPKTAVILKKVHDGKTYLFTVRYGLGATTGEWKWLQIGDTLSHYHPPSKGIAVHSILFGTNTALKPDSVIRQKVLIDPKNPPSSIGVEFVNRKMALSKWFITMDWDHRVFWGDSSSLDIGLRPDSGPHHSHLPMGPLPAPGEWGTLEIPVSKLNLRHADLDDGWNITGAAFSTSGGRAFWGETTVVTEDGKDTPYFTKEEIDWCQSRNETMRINLPGLHDGQQVRVLFEDRVLNAKEGHFEDHFDRNDYACHIYEISDAKAR